MKVFQKAVGAEGRVEDVTWEGSDRRAKMEGASKTKEGKKISSKGSTEKRRGLHS
jgi:hypothetical protein